MMIFFTLFSLLPAGFVIWRGILPLPLSARVKWGLGILTALIAGKFSLVRFSLGLNRWLLLVLAFADTLLLIFALLLAAGELSRLLWALLRRIRRKTPPFPGTIVRGALFCLSLILTGIGIAEGTRMPEVVYEQVALPPGYAGNAPLRIVLLADLHADEMTRSDRIGAIVRRCNELSPDMVVIAGDFADGDVETAGKHLLPLRKLQTRYGVFGVTGNHEYFSGDPRWPSFLKELGIEMLTNESRELPCGVVLAGVPDEAAKRRHLEGPDMEKTWQNIPAGKPVIFLSHRPEWAAEAAEKGAFLQLSGHTHGGMFFPLTLLVSAGNGGWVSGRGTIGGMTLIISNGAGIWSGFPVRIGCPPQIVCIDLIRR